jgi:hypothetical protein
LKLGHVFLCDAFAKVTFLADRQVGKWAAFDRKRLQGFHQGKT